jgi:hypothetical protein
MIDSCNNSIFGERQAEVLAATVKSNNLSALGAEKDCCIEVDGAAEAAA